MAVEVRGVAHDFESLALLCGIAVESGEFACGTSANGHLGYLIVTDAGLVAYLVQDGTPRAMFVPPSNVPYDAEFDHFDKLNGQGLYGPGDNFIFIGNQFPAHIFIGGIA